MYASRQLSSQLAKYFLVPGACHEAPLSPGHGVPTRGRARGRPPVLDHALGVRPLPDLAEQKLGLGNSGSMTARWHFGATKLDRRVAKVIARNATPAVERPAKLLTWAADEHLLLAV